jgi:hypothetical protein
LPSPPVSLLFLSYLTLPYPTSSLHIIRPFPSSFATPLASLSFRPFRYPHNQRPSFCSSLLLPIRSPSILAHQLRQFRHASQRHRSHRLPSSRTLSASSWSPIERKKCLWFHPIKLIPPPLRWFVDHAVACAGNPFSPVRPFTKQTRVRPLLDRLSYQAVASFRFPGLPGVTQLRGFRAP